MKLDESAATFVVRDASKAFGANLVLRELSLCAYPGQVILLLGANGSGKSTLLRICAGLLKPDKGGVKFLSRQPSIGYIGHHSLVYGAMTVKENVELFSQLVSANHSKDLLQRWDLERYSSTIARDLSRGTMLRLGLCRAFLGNPSCLLLDEPTGALDEHALGLFRSEIATLRKASPDSSIVVATHDVNRLIDLATRVIVLNDGAIALDSQDLGDGTSERVVDYYRSLNR
jgi:ABC-type multidrug transport system ATPase subunit